MIRALTLGLLAAVATTSVMAADLIVEEPIAEEALAAYDWNGAYVGAFGGWASGSGDQTITLDTLGFMAPDDAAIDISGGLLGVTAGVNVQMDQFVLGVEGDLAWANVTGQTLLGGGGDLWQTDVNWLGSLRGRLGFAADSVLIYATAGVAAGGVHVTNGDTNDGTTFDPVTGFAETDDFASFGYVVGAGVELGVTENISLKAEYNYIDLGETDFTAPLTVAAADEEGTVDVNLHTVKVGLNFSF